MGARQAGLSTRSRWKKICSQTAYRPMTIVWRYSQSHLGWHFRKLKAQSSNVSFATFQWKEMFELRALSIETAFENVTPSGIGCTSTHHSFLSTRRPQTIGSRGHVSHSFPPPQKWTRHFGRIFVLKRQWALSLALFFCMRPTQEACPRREGLITIVY